MNTSIPLISQFFYDSISNNDRLFLKSNIDLIHDFSLNSSGAIVWKSIQKGLGLDIDKIASNLAQEYSIEHTSDITNDTTKILYNLWIHGFITWKNTNPFDYLNIRTFNEYHIRKYWVDNVDSFFTNTQKHKTIHDIYISLETIKNIRNNASFIYQKNRCYFSLEKGQEKIANLILQIDSIHMIAQIIYLSWTSNYDLDNEITHFITKSIQWASETLLEPGKDKKELLPIIYLAEVDTSDIILSSDNMKLIGTLRNESKAGNVNVFCLK